MRIAPTSIAAPAAMVRHASAVDMRAYAGIVINALPPC